MKRGRTGKNDWTWWSRRSRVWNATLTAHREGVGHMRRGRGSGEILSRRRIALQIVVDRYLATRLQAG